MLPGMFVGRVSIWHAGDEAISLPNEVDDREAKVYYTIPMPPYSVSEETVEVLPFVHHG